jgi:hypothetical protein
MENPATVKPINNSCSKLYGKKNMSIREKMSIAIPKIKASPDAIKIFEKTEGKTREMPFSASSTKLKKLALLFPLVLASILNVTYLTSPLSWER